MPEVSRLGSKKKDKPESSNTEVERIGKVRVRYKEKTIEKYPDIVSVPAFMEAVTKGEMQRAVKAWLISCKNKGITIIPQIEKGWYRD